MEYYDEMDFEDINSEEIQKPPKPPRKKDDFSLLLMQIIVCVAALLAALGIKAIGGVIYNETRSKYVEMFNDKTDAEELIESISKALDPSKSDKDEKNNSSNTGSGKNVSSGTESEKESSKPESDTDSSDEIPSGGEHDSEEEGDAGYIESYSSVSAKIENSAATMNTMLLPVVGKITSGYGFRVHPITGIYGMHSGVDFGANQGTPISAAQQGTVLSVSYSSSYGKYIIISHSGGLATLYAHCSTITAKAGDEIQRGQTIAKVGATGAATGPHLHFEVRINNVRINPTWVLKKVETA